MRASVSALALLLVSVCPVEISWCGASMDGALNTYGSSVGLSAGVVVKFRTILLGFLLHGASVPRLGFEAAGKCFL